MRRILLSAFTLVLAAQEPLSLTAPIQSVRVHPDEAWITRVGQIHLPASGIHRLQFKDLPEGLKLEDIQVAASGPAGLRLGDVTFKSEPDAVKENPEWRKLQGELEALRERRDLLEAQDEAAQQELAYLKGIQATHDQELASRMAYAMPEVASVLALGKGVQERMAELLVQVRKRKRDLEGLAREEARMAGEQKACGHDVHEMHTLLELELVSPRACQADVEISYRSKDAHWRPHYEARLSQDRKHLDLSLYAAVTQETGDDWEGVKLQITSAKAGQDLKVAGYREGRMLWWTRYEVPKTAPLPVTRGSGTAQIMYRVDGIDVADSSCGRTALYSPLADSVPGGSITYSAPTRSDAMPLAPPPSIQATEATALQSREAGDLVQTFKVEGHKDVPSDGEPHRFKLAAADVEPDLVAFVAPRLDPTPVLLARFKVATELPLFADAPVVRFSGNQRLGESSLVIPPAGQSFALGFGPLRSLRVALCRTGQKLEKIGAFTKERQWTLQERVDLENDGREAINLELQDRILKSANEEMKVSLMPGFASGWTESMPGVRTWNLSLQPGEKRKLEVPIQIRAPREGFISSLEDLKLAME